MNINIYYLTKKIVLQEVHQQAQNQAFIHIDMLKKQDFLADFELFINQPNSLELIVETRNLEKGLEKIRKCFKYIYAAGGLIYKDGSYLFIYRLKRWDLPKGKLEMGESPEEAGIRECEEECGITQLTITKILEPTYHIYKHKGGYALKKTFWYEMQTKHEGVLVPQIEESIEKVEWFTKDQIQGHVVNNTYPAILDVLKNISTTADMR